MKIDIEEWSEKNLLDNANKLMQESIICYKVGAYRSAYLMSYLAFKRTICERILNFESCPTSFSMSEWKANIINKLKNDDSWEKFLHDIIVSNPEKNISNKINKIFIYSDKARIINRYNYWKDIRNSCAHAKQEHINSSTVEQFWNYMKDDMCEFYVLGGKSYLKNELLERYHYIVSDKNNDITYLLKDIELVYKEELSDFFTVFLEDVNNKSGLLINEINISFWKQIMYNKNSKIQEAFALSIEKRKSYFLEFYNNFPSILVMIWELKPRFAQEHIKNLLLHGIARNTSYHRNFWQILITALNKFPKIIDIHAITSSYDNFKLIDKVSDIDEYNIVILKDHDIFDKFLRNSGHDLWMNTSADNWTYYRDNYGEKSDCYIIECFKYIKWDLALIEKIEMNYIRLKHSINNRSNQAAKHYGSCRVETYHSILINAKDEITSLCTIGKIELNKYPNIEKILRPQPILEQASLPIESVSEQT